ncbi:alanine racemase [Helicobacter sp. 16-1353]|uniref:alanine racemase n=1 Tax=Helicobacter sp. 16-1353 TaxID=2004996 RepID=UPI000DCD7C47|nr:alanine racemase [Helicobacter sp. 16-1353]RAX53008.1 alanine racemase [Helicobacter sp. 16-1353]
MPILIISKSKLFSNLHILKNTINTQIAAVIKDNAYGHGIEEISNLLVEFGINSVFVKNNFEANKVNNKFQHITILYPNCYENIPNNVYLTISSLDCIQKIPINTGIELKVNTGMNRNGIEPSDLIMALNLIKTQNLRLIGVFTHNAYGDCYGNSHCDDFISQQNLFKQIKNQTLDFVAKHNLPKPRFHSLSSSGAIKVGNVDDDLVRIGIAMYGYLCTNHDIVNELQPIAEIWTSKISSRFLKKGDKVGYEGKYIIQEDCIVSSYDIGYGDGLFRLNENHHKLTTKEGYIILPRMSMDSTSIISNEEEICIMNDASIFANIFGTIPYEILCKISPYMKKVIKE